MRSGLQAPLWIRMLPFGVGRAIADRPNLIRAIANSGWLLTDKLARLVLGLVVGAWVARHLGPTQFGTLAYALASVAILQAFANLSADSIVVRDISQRPDSAPEILGSALILRLGIGVACWALAIVCMAVGGDTDRQTVVLTAVVGGVLVFQAADVVDLWFQSQSQSKRTVFAKLTAYLLSNGVKIGLILIDAPLVAFAAVTALEAALSAVALSIAYKTLQTSTRWRAPSATIRMLLRESWPFMLSGFSIMVYTRVDQLMVKKLLGASDLGIYAAVLPISQLWQVVPLTVAVSLAPMIAQQKVADGGAYRRSMILLFRVFFYAGVVAAVLTYSLSGWVVPALFGPAYLAAVPILDIHVLSNVFCFLGIAHGLWLTNERRFAVRLYGTLLAGITTVFLNAYWLPRLGLIGACYSAIIAQCIAAFLINGLLDRRSFELQLAAITFRRA